MGAEGCHSVSAVSVTAHSLAVHGLSGPGFPPPLVRSGENKMPTEEAERNPPWHHSRVPFCLCLTRGFSVPPAIARPRRGMLARDTMGTHRRVTQRAERLWGMEASLLANVPGDGEACAECKNVEKERLIRCPRGDSGPQEPVNEGRGPRAGGHSGQDTQEGFLWGHASQS